MEYTGQIKFDKVASSIGMLSSIENHISHGELEKYFAEMEKIINSTNYNHDNCISNYKQYLNEILLDISSIKSEIKALNSQLKGIITEFDSIDEINHRDLKKQEFSTLKVANDMNNPNNTTPGISEEDINPITPVVQEEYNESKDFTIPIAIGVAATGIVGSISAIIIDNNKRKRKKPNLDFEDYTSSDDIEIEEKKKNQTAQDTLMNQNSNEVFEPSPYKAVRDKRSADENYFDNMSLDLDSVKIDNDKY